MQERKERLYMRRQLLASLLKRLWQDESGQDLIEYALLAATLAIVVAGFFPPTIAPSISTIFSKLSAIMDAS